MILYFSLVYNYLLYFLISLISFLLTLILIQIPIPSKLSHLVDLSFLIIVDYFPIRLDRKYQLLKIHLTSTLYFHCLIPSSIQMLFFTALSLNYLRVKRSQLWFMQELQDQFNLDFLLKKYFQLFWKMHQEALI